MSNHIHVPLPSDAPIPEEQLAAEPLGGERWRLTSAPFVAYDLCRGDIVACRTEADDRVVFDHLVESAGHHTIRVLLQPDLDLMASMKALMPLRERGCTAEDPKGRYYALTTGPETEVDELLAHLEAQSDAGLYEFEIFGSSTTG